MKTSRCILLAAATALVCLSCKEDNMKNFDAVLYGSVIDTETGETIQQEEPGGSSVQIMPTDAGTVRTATSIPFKTGGTYRFSRIHSGHYLIQASGNFYPPEAKETEVRGETRYDLQVMPYARVKDPLVSYNPTKAKVKATFKIDSKEKISRIVLLCHQSSRVSQGLQTAMMQEEPERMFEPDEEVSLVLKTQNLNNRDYFVRIGVLAENAPTNMFNYSVSFPVAVDNTQYDGKLDGEIDSYASGLAACWDGLNMPVDGVWTDYVRGRTATMDAGIIQQDGHLVCLSQGGRMDEAVDFPEACTFEILVRNPTDKGCFLIDARENDTGYQVMYLENAASVQTYSSFGGEKSFSVPNLDDGNVHLLSVVITATESRMYCDGIQTDASEAGYGGAYTGHIHIGERFTGSAKYTGDLYSFRYYTRALSSEDIRINYQNDIQRFKLE